MVGESTLTESAPILSATVPDQPHKPLLKSQSKSHLEIQWTDPLNDGGTAIESYIVEMDDGAGHFTVVQTQTNTPTDSYYTSTFMDIAG